MIEYSNITWSKWDEKTWKLQLVYNVYVASIMWINYVIGTYKDITTETLYYIKLMPI